MILIFTIKNYIKSHRYSNTNLGILIIQITRTVAIFPYPPLEDSTQKEKKSVNYKLTLIYTGRAV